ncbi:MAG TPA: phosphatase PAP2 family protein [Mycobacteriales bacterium]|nr:phosphatase PAP2 family protein [Mycobacteriales bacterium]
MTANPDGLVRTPTTPAERAAKVVSEILSPYIVLIVLPVATAYYATDSLPSAIGWGLLVAGCVSFLPLGLIGYGAKKGLWEGKFVRNREARRIPLLICIAGVVLALGLRAPCQAPHLLTTLSLTLLAISLPCLLITQWWKISLHAATSAGAAVVMQLLYGWPLVLLWPLVAAICWSRVVLRDHTVAQILVGVLLGAILGGTTFITFQ